MVCVLLALLDRPGVHARSNGRKRSMRKRQMSPRGAGRSLHWRDRCLMKNPVLALPLHAVMRPEISLPLQHMLNIYTVGCLLRAWRSPRSQKSIEKLFDSPEQARHAAATCAAWLGFGSHALHEPVPAWWV